MRNNAKGNIVVYLFPVVLFISACAWFDFISGDVPATNTPDIPIENANVVGGSFEDFSSYATNIATALHNKDALFFEQYSVSSIWNCLGDETLGVCQDHSGGKTLEGIPVTIEWGDYELYTLPDYSHKWEATFALNDYVKLVALGIKYGDNPLMPMAAQSFLAIIAVGDSSQLSLLEARVLFFEYYENSWRIWGELDTSSNSSEPWLSDACVECYDVWVAWEK